MHAIVHALFIAGSMTWEISWALILALLMSWQFTLAEFTGGPVMIVIVAVMFRPLLRDRLLRQARQQADRGLAGSMEGRAVMDMPVRREGSFTRRLLSGEAFTSVSDVFVMERAAIIRDLAAGPSPT